MGQAAQPSCILGSLVLSIPLLNNLFRDALKNWQLAVYKKTIIFFYIYIAMTFLVAVSI